MSESHATLPEQLDRPVRMASVPPYLRDVFERLPVPLTLEVELPREAVPLPMAARQLLKLSLVAPKLRLERVELLPGRAQARAVAQRGPRRCVLGPEELGGNITLVARRLLEELLDKEHFLQVLEAFAFQSSNLEALQSLSHHMLRASDLDQALYVLLSGITSGEALGFNRVALFLYEEQRRCFVGSKAIGPADASEAHRIWEAIEYESKSMAQQIEDCERRNFDTRFQQYVQALEVVESGAPGDEVAEACRTQGPLLFLQERLVNESLRALEPARPFALAVVQPHDKRLGLLFADNLYSGTPVTLEQMRFLRFYIDQTALIWENLSLLHREQVLARHDALTGVLNRRALEARLVEEQQRCGSSQQACSLMILDVDWFKELNDRLGHQAGDEALRTLAALLREALRPGDAVARYGGDEFVVVLPGCRREQAAAIAVRIGRLARTRGLSLSVGVASWPEDCREPRELLASADAHLYVAKRAGRGRACGGPDQVLVF